MIYCIRLYTLGRRDNCTNIKKVKGLPGSSFGKESPHNSGDSGLIPGMGRSPGEGKGYLLQYSGLENFMNCIVHGVVKSCTRLINFCFQRNKVVD